MGKLVMGYWDCPSCGKSVPGTLRSCPSCSTARGADVKFYMKDIEYLSDEEAAKIGKNPDWLCEYCGTYNNDNDVNCKGCGAVRGNDNKDYFDNNTELKRSEVKDETKWECAYCGAQNPQSATQCQTCKADRTEKKKEEIKAPEKPKKRSLLPLFILLGVIGIAILIAILSKPKKATITVNSIDWESTVAVEDLVQKKGKTTDYSTIKNKDDIFDITTETYTEYEKVGTKIDHVDKGNGTFEEVEVDVYDNVVKERKVYHYYYTEWDVTRKVKNSGSGNTPVYSDPGLSGTERIKSKTSVFTVKAKDENGKEVTYKVTDDGIASKLTAGSKYNVLVKNNEIVGFQ